MGLAIFSNIADIEYMNSRKLTKSLTKLQIQQSTSYNIKNDDISKVKNQIKNDKVYLYATSLQEIFIDLLTENVRLNKINQQQAASV